MVKKATMESKSKATMCKSIKTVPETGVKSDLAFCFGSLNKKTNSEGGMAFTFWRQVHRCLPQWSHNTCRFRFGGPTFVCRFRPRCRRLDPSTRPLESAKLWFASVQWQLTQKSVPFISNHDCTALLTFEAPHFFHSARC